MQIRLRALGVEVRDVAYTQARMPPSYKRRRRIERLEQTKMTIGSRAPTLDRRLHRHRGTGGQCSASRMIHLDTHAIRITFHDVHKYVYRSAGTEPK